ncbi:MAG TPA: sigma-70 family RNA polymerase sigma factor [Pirellulales bacterium]|jgi:RNA polymerase sigma-70 factor (ECF subfamily)|nr:sigma-70 family RNA polymerase sigma factor [Pirellulales bacterium]
MSVLSVELTDEKLALIEQVRAAQAGDRDAFGELVERFERSVYATALRRLGNHVEAQELTQEVFVQALRKIHQLREPECFGGWLRTIANRLAINRRTRSGPATPTDRETLEAVCLEHETPLTKALTNERQRQVRDGLDRLGALDRETLIAFYVDGQSLIEMSTAFDSPVGTIKRRLHVARKRLARELEEMAN